MVMMLLLTSISCAHCLLLSGAFCCTQVQLLLLHTELNFSVFQFAFCGSELSCAHFTFIGCFNIWQFYLYSECVWTVLPCSCMCAHVFVQHATTIRYTHAVIDTCIKCGSIHRSAHMQLYKHVSVYNIFLYAFTCMYIHTHVKLIVYTHKMHLHACTVYMWQLLYVCWKSHMCGSCVSHMTIYAS